MQLIERTFMVLSILSQETQGLSVSSVANKVDIPASSAYRILSALKENNLVLQDSATKKYRIGYKLLSLTQNISQNNSLIESSKDYLIKLSRSINSTVELCVLEGNNIVCLDYIQNKDTTHFYVKTGFAMPTHATSAGKVIHAYSSKQDVKKYFKSANVSKVTDKTITSLDDYIKELEIIREQRYSVCDEELQLNVQGFACPIFNAYEQIVASVSFTALKEKFILFDEIINKLKKCAENISYNIGYRGGNYNE